MNTIDRTINSFFNEHEDEQPKFEKSNSAKEHIGGHTYVPLEESNSPIAANVVLDCISQSPLMPDKQASRAFCSGNDPFEAMRNNPQDRSLLYGLANPRHVTRLRLAQAAKKRYKQSQRKINHREHKSPQSKNSRCFEGKWFSGRIGERIYPFFNSSSISACVFRM